MSFNDARQFTAKAGIRMAPIMDGMALPQVTTKEQLDELFAEGYEEMERFGHSDKYNQAVALMAQGADDLVSLGQLNGAIPRSMADMAADVADAQASSAQFLMRDRLPSALRDMHIGGQHISEIPIEILHDQMAMVMADSQPGPGRDAVSQLMAHIDSTPATSFTGIRWEAPDPRLEFTCNSSTSIAESNDAFGRLRAPGMAADHGLESLQIRPSVFNDALLSGVVNYAGGGGEYSVHDDYVYQAAVAQQGGDYHQGDSSNTFEMD